MRLRVGGGGVTCSRSPARFRKGQDHSLSLLTPRAAWRSPYVEFLRKIFIS